MEVGGDHLKGKFGILINKHTHIANCPAITPYHKMPDIVLCVDYLISRNLRDRELVLVDSLMGKAHSS